MCRRYNSNVNVPINDIALANIPFISKLLKDSKSGKEKAKQCLYSGPRNPYLKKQIIPIIPIMEKR